MKKLRFFLLLLASTATLVACDSEGGGNSISEPAVPTGLSAIASDDTVELRWDSTNRANSYKIYRNTIFLDEIHTTSYTDTNDSNGLEPGTYAYIVSAVNESGETNSSAVSAIVEIPVPEAPTNLNLEVNEDSVRLNWDAVEYAVNYKVYRDGSLVEEGIESTNYTDTNGDNGLEPGTYAYIVSAVNESGETNSSAVSATVEIPVPEAPTVRISEIGEDYVTLSWDVVKYADNYKVYRDSTFLYEGNTTSYTDTNNNAGLEPADYDYQVTAVNASGETNSSVVRVTITLMPAAPANLSAQVDEENITLSWDDVEYAEGYQVYRDGTQLAEVHTTYYIDIGIITHATADFYTYEVAAFNNVGESSTSTFTITDEDPLQTYQWHLENTGQDAFAARSGVAGEDIAHDGALSLGISGNGVRVNVIDTGLELVHPDLAPNIVDGGSYDYLGDDDDPTNNIDTDGDHGTSVAGLIAASGDNWIGISGVAPEAQLQGFNFLNSDQSWSDYLLAHGLDDKLEDTDIFNKSLGAERTTDWRINNDLLETLSCLTTGGVTDNDSTCTGALREELGAIYVKSAGNGFSADGSQICDQLGVTCYNTNMEPEQTYPYQIVVGALNADGEKSSYSTAGSALWIAAPGGEYGQDYNYINSELNRYGYSLSDIDPTSPRWQPAMVTTDQIGCERGYTTNRIDFEISGVPLIGVTSFHEDELLNPDCAYTSTFNGTSSAAPVLSGVVALMLEANPDLNWREVKHILAITARQVDEDIPALEVPLLNCTNDCSDGQYTASSTTFNARDGWIENAAGFRYHNWYGFGSVDAGMAVNMAQSYNGFFGEFIKFSTATVDSGEEILDVSATPVEVYFDLFGEAITIEAVQLDLNITHSDIADLALVLNSPEGTRSVLLTPFNEYDDFDLDNTLLTNAFYGEDVEGTWTLEVYDLREGGIGMLNRAQLHFYGEQL